MVFMCVCVCVYVYVYVCVCVCVCMCVCVCVLCISGRCVGEWTQTYTTGTIWPFPWRSVICFDYLQLFFMFILNYILCLFWMIFCYHYFLIFILFFIICPFPWRSVFFFSFFFFFFVFHHLPISMAIGRFLWLDYLNIYLKNSSCLKNSSISFLFYFYSFVVIIFRFSDFQIFRFLSFRCW